jgi:hypothetical protein
VAGALRARAEVSGGGTRTLWEGKLDDGTCMSYPARSSTAVASGNLIVGSWDKLTIAVWNSGIELAINPFGDPVSAPNNFARGVIGIRAFCSLDVGLSYPSAFTVASAVT